MITDGFRVRWRGEEFPASPDGALLRVYTDTPRVGFEEVRPGRYRTLLPMVDAEWWGYVRTVGRFRGQPVVVLAERGDEILVEYAGGEAGGAVATGLPTLEPGVEQGWVRRSEVAELQEWRSSR